MLIVACCYHIDFDSPLIISNSDQIIDSNLSDIMSSFQNSQASSGVATFNSVHPRWSYVLANSDKIVEQAFEKDVKSKNAVAGFYYFDKASYFIDSAKKVIINDVNVNGMYFISSALNELILLGKKVMHSPIPASSYHSFYAPSKIDEFERTSCAQSIRNKSDDSRFVNILIPAAGEGSRFKKTGWKKPKPFIDVDGKPMIKHVINNISSASSKVSILLRSEHFKGYPTIVESLASSVDNIIQVPNLTEGTASTVLLARKVYDNQSPLLIANSDQLVDFDVNSYIDDCFDRNLDGSILVFREPTLDEKWSFAKLDSEGFVSMVAEKKAISDLATVGIYLFSKGSEFVSAAIDMIAANERVNNEFYTCPIYNYMIKSGAKIGVYEISASSMSGLGTPSDLSAYLTKINAPISSDSPSS